jgi:hypothetical protein
VPILWIADRHILFRTVAQTVRTIARDPKYLGA